MGWLPRRPGLGRRSHKDITGAFPPSHAAQHFEASRGRKCHFEMGSDVVRREQEEKERILAWELKIKNQIKKTSSSRVGM